MAGQSADCDILAISVKRRQSHVRSGRADLLSVEQKKIRLQYDKAVNLAFLYIVAPGIPLPIRSELELEVAAGDVFKV
jgi:hypothetical protein